VIKKEESSTEDPKKEEVNAKEPKKEESNAKEINKNEGNAEEPKKEEGNAKEPEKEEKKAKENGGSHLDEKERVEDNDSSDERELVVEALVDSRIKKERKQYRVKWQGYGSEFNTWEDEEALMEIAPELVKKFKK